MLDNVGLGLRGDWRSRGLEVLRHVGLHERAGDWIARLSGGQRQRVALAKALITQPRLMLLDEPLGALDALTRIEMQQLIENLWLEEGFTSILVTHDVEEAVTLADRILVLEEGRIARDFRNDLQRLRRRGDPGFSQLTAEILDTILTQGGQGSAPQKTADHATEAVTPEHGHSPRPTGQPAGARGSERSDSPHRRALWGPHGPAAIAPRQLRTDPHRQVTVQFSDYKREWKLPHKMGTPSHTLPEWIGANPAPPLTITTAMAFRAPTTSRRSVFRLALATGLALAGTLGLSSSSSALAQAKPASTVRLDYAYYNPVSLVLKDRGILEKELKKKNIKVEWVLSQGSNKALEFLGARSLDFGSTAGAAAFIGKANGNPIKAIYVYSKPEWASLVVPNGSKIKSVKDLKGKKVAANRGTDPYIFLLRTLDRNGLAPATWRLCSWPTPTAKRPWRRAMLMPGRAWIR